MNSKGWIERHLFSNPLLIVETTQHSEITNRLTELEKYHQEGFHIVGFLSYEAAHGLDSQWPKPIHSSTFPLLYFAVFQSPDQHSPPPSVKTQAIDHWEMNTTEQGFTSQVDRIQKAISDGELYQANLSVRLNAHGAGLTLADYDAWQNEQQPRYGAFIDTQDFQVISLSPELFFKVEGDIITTCPMKGTAPRGETAEQDQAFATNLANSSKDQAENIMIVDLLRNDLAKISQLHSIQAEPLFSLESYPTVWQMTSTVQGKLRGNITFPQILQALFPSGSITGAPKRKAMEWIQELEKNPRGPYCGSIGWIKPNGDMVFNVAIRTLWNNKTTSEWQAGLGAGITIGSQAAQEFQEIQWKGRYLNHAPTPAPNLIESLRLEQGAYPYYEGHLGRLIRSAAALGFPSPESSVKQALGQTAQELPENTYKVRLCYRASGQIHIGYEPIQSLTHLPAVTLAASPIIFTTNFLYKTTNRQAYEPFIKEIQSPFWDVLLWNDKGFITEFTRGNMVWEDQDGGLWTPPLECGLLPGVFREHLIKSNTIHEKLISVKEMPIIKRLWFINAVREWISVRLVYPPSITEQIFSLPVPPQ
jgi:para-aminobenzoate synthetase/4-amino-4-deoxychorismate lyase